MQHNRKICQVVFIYRNKQTVFGVVVIVATVYAFDFLGMRYQKAKKKLR